MALTYWTMQIYYISVLAYVICNFSPFLTQVLMKENDNLQAPNRDIEAF